MSARKTIAAIAVLTGCGPSVPIVTRPHPVCRDAPRMPKVALDMLNSLTCVNYLVCPDGSTDCCQTNGTGVYTAESGYAGIGPHSLMITHFINSQKQNNNQPEVRFAGRYYDNIISQWLFLPDAELGRVDSADYQQMSNLEVVGVHETDTVPTWTLLDSQTQQAFAVSGSDLVNLTLHISFDTAHALAQAMIGLREHDQRIALPPLQDGSRESYLLNFNTAPSLDSTKVVHNYSMSWRSEPQSKPAEYCVDADAGGDPVVFQQGMSVDPLKGIVDHAQAAMVTMSCRQGAIATVHGWGYSYAVANGQPNEPKLDVYYFDAGIHMKRAAYCGDFHHYTRAGIKIEIADNFHGWGPGGWGVQALEARWTPQGATCLNLPNVRDSETVAKEKFEGVCPTITLGPCLAEDYNNQPPPPHYLASGKTNQ